MKEFGDVDSEKEVGDVENGNDDGTPDVPNVAATRHIRGEGVNLCDTVTKRVTWCFVIFCVLLAVGIILAFSIKRVESTEYGVVYDVHTKQLQDAVQSGVLHVGPPG